MRNLLLKNNALNTMLVVIPVLLGVIAYSGIPDSLTASSHHIKQMNSDSKGVMHFYEEVHDFGMFDEGKTMSYRFEFENVGDGDVVITNVKASCGCTTPAYSKKPVKPNEFGYIDVQYNSVNRPGAFNKKIYVENNGSPAMIVLTIKGNAKPAPITGKDLTQQGGLLISEGVIEVGNWKLGEVFRHELKVQNTTDSPIKLQTYEADNDIRVSFPPYSILAGEKVSVGVVFQADVKRKSGKFSSLIKIHSTDKAQPVKIIELRGNLVGTQKSSLESPRLEFDKTYIDLGNVIQHDKVLVAFAFQNKGKGQLEINDVEPSCGCTVVEEIKPNYAPGERDTIKAVLDTEDKFGIIRKEITVKSNDPNQAELVLIIEANVTEHPDPVRMAEMRATAGANASIFSGECRSCHVDRGVGKLGKDLYVASCQMCHGPAGFNDGKKHPGTIFTTDYLTETPDNVLQTLIAEGSPDPRKKGMMPGFQAEFGGPLSKEQVSSLTVYLKSLPSKLN